MNFTVFSSSSVVGDMKKGELSEEFEKPCARIIKRNGIVNSIENTKGERFVLSGLNDEPQKTTTAR